MDSNQNTEKTENNQTNENTIKTPHETQPEQEENNQKTGDQKTNPTEASNQNPKNLINNSRDSQPTQTQENPPIQTEETEDLNMDFDILEDDEETQTEAKPQNEETILDPLAQLKKIDENEEPSNVSENAPEPAQNSQENHVHDKQDPTHEEKSRKSTGSDMLKEENLYETGAGQTPNIGSEMRTLFPTDNESLDTANESAMNSTNLTSRFKNKGPKSRTRKAKRKMQKGAYTREKGFNVTGLVHLQIKEYNSLTDHSLKKFFCSPQKVRHMTKVGLITKSGLIVKNPEIFLKMKRQRREYLLHLPKIARRENRSEKNLHQRSTLSEKEVRKAFKAKSVRAKRRLQKKLSPMGRFKENRRQPRKKLKGKNVVTKRKLENYFRQIENLYNLK